MSIELKEYLSNSKTDFKTSVTKDNLMRAFAGESQARNRYTFASQQAKSQGLYVIQAVFDFTANQEKEHAEIFYGFLKDMAGETVYVDGGYPVDIDNNIVNLLRAAQHNEYEEYDPIYKSFGDKAKEEGFEKIAATFHMIAKIEKIHGDRFAKFADMIENNELFVSNVETGWMCLNCGYVYEGKEALKVCPVCNHEKGYFIRLDLAPFSNEKLL